MDDILLDEANYGNIENAIIPLNIKILSSNWFGGKIIEFSENSKLKEINLSWFDLPSQTVIMISAKYTSVTPTQQ